MVDLSSLTLPDKEQQSLFATTFTNLTTVVFHKQSQIYHRITTSLSVSVYPLRLMYCHACLLLVSVMVLGSVEADVLSCMPVTGVCNGVCISSLLTCSSLSPSPSPACSRAMASSSLVFSSYACESVMSSYVHMHLHTTILPSYYLPLSC